VTDARSLDARFNAALARRKSLLDNPAIEAVRLFHGRADGIDNLVVEKWGPVLIVQLHEALPGPTPDELLPVMQQWREQFGATAVYLKHFVRNRGGTEAQSGSDPAPDR
jgi:23S rRNA G2069 N7-methylase RlmK/C1962 C5-methylase RlmI